MCTSPRRTPRRAPRLSPNCCWVMFREASASPRRASASALRISNQQCAAPGRSTPASLAGGSSAIRRCVMPRVAVLDDYQGVALEMANWSTLPSDCQVQVFRDHLTDLTALAERLSHFEIVTCMRERTPFRRDLLERLPNLR